VDEVFLATLNVVRNISAGRQECLMPHTVGDAVVASDPENHHDDDDDNNDDDGDDDNDDEEF